MYIRTYQNEIVLFDINKYPTEKQMYVALWKLKYNADVSKSKSFNVLDYIK